MNFAIIGGGVAALTAAEAVRKADAKSMVSIYSREAVAPYRRPALAGMVATTREETQFYIRPASFYKENRIELNLSYDLIEINLKCRELHFANGTRAVYDRLLLATGAHCFIPPIPGRELDGVCSLREYADLLALRRRIDAGIRRATVIGGGLLGLELAASLLERGLEVTVIEGSPTLLPRNLDPEGSEFLRRQLDGRNGLHLHFGESVTRIGGAGKVEYVELGSDRIASDLVVVSAGARSNVEIASKAGIVCNRGIVTDGYLRTSAAEVYAAGDGAEVEGNSYGLYNAARQMGSVAGGNLAGGDTKFVPEVFPARLVVFGTKLFSAGSLSGERSEVESSPEKGTFQKLFYDGTGRLTGCVLIGDLRNAVKLQTEIART